MPTDDTRPPFPLVCALCMFVGDSEDPEPLTILNGQLGAVYRTLVAPLRTVTRGEEP